MYTQYPRLQRAICRLFIHKTQRYREWTVDRQTGREGETEREKNKKKK